MISSANQEAVKFKVQSTDDAVFKVGDCYPLAGPLLVPFCPRSDFVLKPF